MIKKTKKLEEVLLRGKIHKELLEESMDTLRKSACEEMKVGEDSQLLVLESCDSATVIWSVLGVNYSIPISKELAESLIRNLDFPHGS